MKKILFDLGGVCISDYWARQDRILLAKRFNLNYEKLEEYHLKNLKRILIGKISEEEYFDGLFLYQNQEPQTKKIIKYLQEKDYALQEVLDFVKELSKDQKVYAFTNEIREAAEYRIKKFNLNNYFEKIFVSGIMGYEKFDKEAYQYIAEELQVKSSEIIFIDNSKENIKKAQESGLTTIHFKDIVQLKRDLMPILYPK